YRGGIRSGGLCPAPNPVLSKGCRLRWLYRRGGVRLRVACGAFVVLTVAPGRTLPGSVPPPVSTTALNVSHRQPLSCLFACPACCANSDQKSLTCIVLAPGMH